MSPSEQEIQTAADEHYASRFSEIERLLRILKQADELDHQEWVDEIRERIEQMPLCVTLNTISVRSETCEWEILLGTGGPADRVLVTTDYRGEVDEATYQYQDWFTPWTDAHDQEFELVEQFAECFYFGELADQVELLGLDRS